MRDAWFEGKCSSLWHVKEFILSRVSSLDSWRRICLSLKTLFVNPLGLCENWESSSVSDIERFNSRDYRPYRFTETKESICIKIEFNSQRFSLGHQHGRHFFVLGHQHGRRDVMWKHSIDLSLKNQTLINFNSFTGELWDRLAWALSVLRLV